MGAHNLAVSNITKEDADKKGEAYLEAVEEKFEKMDKETKDCSK